MLVLASDACDMDTWPDDNASEKQAEAARRYRAALASTLDAVRTWMLRVLQPREPEVLNLTRANA